MKFLLLTTGGTIASAPSEKGFAPDPALSGEKLLNACPLLMGFEHDLEIVNLFSKDSSDITPSDWLDVAKAVREREQDAVVVLHGTDTMAWTASALSYLLHGAPFPVVLTGSMLTPNDPGTDVPDNIYAAFQFALQLVLYKRKGVSVAFSDFLIHGPKATKLDSRRKNAFASIDYPLLGEMKDKDDHKVAWLTPHAPNFSQETPPWGKGSSPAFETRIALVPIFPGMPASGLDAVLTTAPKAVVLEGYGLGGVPCPSPAQNLLASIEKGVKAGIPFILRTQSPFGGTDPSLYEVGQRALDLGVISAEDMTREALMTKLMLLLPLLDGEKPSSRNSVLEKYLRANFCDDVTR